jgi:hypothetical protein
MTGNANKAWIHPAHPEIKDLRIRHSAIGYQLNPLIFMFFAER